MKTRKEFKNLGKKGNYRRQVKETHVCFLKVPEEGRIKEGKEGYQRV